MAQANPGQTLSGITASGAGSTVDLTGASTAVAVPTTMSMVVTVTNFASSYNAAVNAAYPYLNIGLEVSLDGTNWVRLTACQAGANGQYKAAASGFPARYARANVDSFDTRITGVTLNAYVAGGQ